MQLQIKSMLSECVSELPTCYQHSSWISHSWTLRRTIDLNDNEIPGLHPDTEDDSVGRYSRCVSPDMKAVSVHLILISSDDFMRVLDVIRRMG